jgi:hypothetical protein
VAFGKEMPDEQIDIYIDALHDIPGEQLAQAVKTIIGTERFFPAVATIRQTALVDPSRLSAEEAWGFISRRIQSGGRMAGTRGLTDDTKRSVDACGGWPALCESTNPTGDRITFTKAYNAVTTRNDRTATNWKLGKGLRRAIASIGRGDI